MTMDDPTPCLLCGDVADPDDRIAVEVPQIGGPVRKGVFCEGCARLVADEFREWAKEMGVQP